MGIDRDKIDEVTLALLQLVKWEHKKLGIMFFKGFDWETLARLYKKGYIENPKNTYKCIKFTDEGLELSKELFKEFFEN